MNTLRRILLGLCLALLAASPVVAAEKSIVIGLSSDTLFLDPQQQKETITNAICRHFYETLLAKTPDNSQLVPVLAESWELAPDQGAWIFHLRKAVKFSDGTPFTAEDVQFTVERARGNHHKDLISTVKEVQIVDAHTAKFVTHAPDGVLLDKIAQLPIMSKAYTTRVGNDEVNLKPMGTGPYLCTAWVKEDHISFVANPNYWGKQPPIRNVRFRPITNAATRTAALLSGELDLTEDIPVRDIARVTAAKGIDVVSRMGNRLIYLHIDGTRSPTPAINLPVNPMTDVRVRRAISMAIDRETIVKVTMNNNGYPTGQMVLPGQRGNIPGMALPAYDPEKAKQLLKEAGYEKGFTVKLDAPNGRYPNDAQIAQAIAAQLAKIGVTVDLMLHPKSVFFDYVRPGDKSSLVMTGWADEVDAGALGNVLFYSRGKNPAKGGSNRCFYANAEYDKLLDDADATADVSRRKELLEKASRVILDDVGIIPILFNQDVYGKKSTVKFTPRVDKQIHAYTLDSE